MHKKVSALLLLFAIGFRGTVALAQDSTAAKTVEMADRLRADGKIYVVIAVLLIILLGLILYVVRLDRKIARLERSSR
jgi:hypothetical protein